MNAGENCLDALRLSDTERCAILREMNQKALAPTGREMRRSERYPYDVPGGIEVQVDGSRSRFVVRTRNLSSTGLGFLHGTFLYAGTRCVAKLKTPGGQVVSIPGRVVRCRWVQGRVHDVGLRFELSIDVRDFIGTPADQAATDPGMDQPKIRAAANVPVIRLARELEQLATQGAPRTRLCQKIAELIEVVRTS